MSMKLGLALTWPRRASTEEDLVSDSLFGWSEVKELANTD